MDNTAQEIRSLRGEMRADFDKMRADFDKVFDRIRVVEQRACPCQAIIEHGKDITALQEAEKTRQERERNLYARIWDVILRWGPLAMTALWNQIPHG